MERELKSVTCLTQATLASESLYNGLFRGRDGGAAEGRVIAIAGRW